MNIQTWLKETEELLKSAGIETYKLDSSLLLQNVLKRSREWILTHEDYLISRSELNILNKNVLQRKERTPLAYIIGSKEFYGHDFIVTKDTLVPRPESEAIIELLVKRAPSKAPHFNTVIDVGTGTGCLAITTKLLYPDLHVTAIDSSSSALSVAKENARKYQVRIQFKLLDIEDGLPAMPKTRPFAIIANLPYVPEDLITSPEITKEPRLALFAGKDGLRTYRTFWDQVSKMKNRPTAIITESLKDQHSEQANLAKRSGYHLVDTLGLAQHFEQI